MFQDSSPCGGIWMKTAFQLALRDDAVGGSGKTGRTASSCLASLMSYMVAALTRLADRAAWIGGDGPVCPNAVGSFMTDTSLRNHYKAAFRRTSLRELHFHDPCHAHDREGWHPSRAGVDRPRRTCRRG